MLNNGLFLGSLSGVLLFLYRLGLFFLFTFNFHFRRKLNIKLFIDDLFNVLF